MRMKVSQFRIEVARVRSEVEVESNGRVIGIWTPVGFPQVTGDAVPTLVKENHNSIVGPEIGEIEEMLREG